MKLSRFPTWAATSLLILSAGLVSAQPAEPPGEEEEIPEVVYSIKVISLSLFGGFSSGATFFELPPLEDRTQIEEGSDDVYRYDGTIFNLPEYYDAPQKEIRSGTLFGGKVGFYLSDQFHIDLVASLTRSKATTSFLNRDPRMPVAAREQLDEDSGFRSYMGGFNLMYDVSGVQLLGLTPNFGLGLGGIINTFSGLQDKTALYFRLLAGFGYHLRDDLLLVTQFSATTFSFNTEELNYGKQVTYAVVTAGLSWNFDVTH